jgi:hypothetical protein
MFNEYAGTAQSEGEAAGCSALGHGALGSTEFSDGLVYLRICQLTKKAPAPRI